MCYCGSEINSTLRQRIGFWLADRACRCNGDKLKPFLSCSCRVMNFCVVMFHPVSSRSENMLNQ